MNEFYCPYCQRYLYPERDSDGIVIRVDGGFIYLHYDVHHDDDYEGQSIQ